MPGAFLATNLITSAATITPSTENTAYPRANLYDKIAAKVFRCTSPTALTILIDFGANVTADTIALINHNLSAGATISLKADGSNPPTTAIASPTYRANDLWKAFTSTTARYWLLTIASGGTANLQIGQLILGVRTAFPRGRRIGNYSPKVDRQNISMESYGGAVNAYQLFDRKNFNPTFRVLESERSIFTALDLAVKGNLYPFLYIPDGTGADCHYARKEVSYEPQEIDKSTEIVYDYQMTLVEESRGLEVLA
jgi:hypothetical protein